MADKKFTITIKGAGLDFDQLVDKIVATKIMSFVMTGSLLLDSGGAGSPEHLYLALTEGKADAALAASIFHYGEYPVPVTKKYLAERGVAVRI